MHYQWPSLPVVVMLGRQIWQPFTWTGWIQTPTCTCCHAYPCMSHVVTFAGWIYIQGQRESPCHLRCFACILHLHAFASFASFAPRMALWLGFSPNCRSYMSMDDFPSKTCHPWASFHWGPETTWRVHWAGVQPWLTTPNFAVPWLLSILCFNGHDGHGPGFDDFDAFFLRCCFSDWQGWFRVRNLMEFGSWRTKGTEGYGLPFCRVKHLPQLTLCSNRFWAELMSSCNLEATPRRETPYSKRFLDPLPQRHSVLSKTVLSSNFNKATFVVLRWPTRKKWINGSWPWRREFRMASLADDFFIPTVVIVVKKRLILWIGAKRSNAAMLALAGTYFIHFGDPVVACFRQPPSNDHEWSSRSV